MKADETRGVGMPMLKRPAGKKLYTPQQVWNNETFGLDAPTRILLRVLFGVLTDSQQVRAMQGLGWMVAPETGAVEEGVAAQPELPYIVKP